MILKNCLIITQNQKREIIPDGFLAIKNGKINLIGKGNSEKIFSKEKTIDLRGKVIMPGLINAHCHLGDLIYKGIGRSLKSPVNLLKITSVIDFKIGKKEIRKMKQTASLNSIDIFLKEGITTLAGGRGLKEATRRGVRFFGGVMIRGREDIFAEIKKVKEECGKSKLLFPGIFLHSLLEISKEKLYSLKKIARIKGFAIMLHLAEFPEEKHLVFKKYGKERIELLKEIGLLSKERKIVAVHGNFLEEKEIRELSKYGASLVLCPANSQKFGYKITSLNLLKKYGIKKAIATDGPLSNPKLNLLQDIRLFSSLNGEKISRQELLDYITIEAAEVLGIEKKVGSLEPGKFADILILRCSTVIKNKERDFILKRVLEDLPKNIESTMIGGKQSSFVV